jgi:hypothetical protein
LIPPFEGYERTQIDANARLIAAAGAAAHECAEMGYDPIEAVRALPQVLRALASMHDDPNTYADDAAAEALARAAGKEGA